MPSCPLYQRPKNNGTTFYAFPGAEEDIASAYQNSNKRMYFSKYVLLNLPKQTLTAGTNSNTITWDFENSFQQSPSAVPAPSFTDGFVESLRNYVANHEVTLRESRINNTDYYYDSSQLNTTSERIFWKWCKKLNIIDFEKATAGDDYLDNLPEFASIAPNDQSYFPEVLWKERETTKWQTVSFYETGEAGYSGNLEIELLGQTNIRTGDTIELTEITDTALLSEIGNGKRCKVLKSIDATTSAGQRLVVDIDPYSSGTVGSGTGKANVHYHKLVRYIGEVNGVNNVQQANRSYTEVYAHVPDHTGETPDVLFRTLSDTNYKPNMAFPILPSQYQPEILGAEDFTNPIVSNPPKYPGSYWGQFDTADYTYETATGDANRRSGRYYGVSGTIFDPVYNGGEIDGASLDFDPAHYAKMNIIGREVTNFDSFNAMEIDNEPPKSFEFNAILWYYTVENNLSSATNLYGITLLDNPANNTVESERNIRFPVYKKFATTSQQDGNSYAFSLNLTFLLRTDNPQDTYNPQAINSLFNFNLFNDAMARLGNVNASFVSALEKYTTIENKVSDLAQLLYSQTDIQSLTSRMGTLESLLNMYSTNQIVDSDSVSVETDNSVSPPRIQLRASSPKWPQVTDVLASDMYANGAPIPVRITVPEKSGFLVNVTNNDTNTAPLPENQTLYILLDRDLDLGQECEIRVRSLEPSTENKKLEIWINYLYSQTGSPVETRVYGPIDLPVSTNSVTGNPNVSKKWDNMAFEPDLNKDISLLSKTSLEMYLKDPAYLVSSSFASGDSINISNLIVGTGGNINLSGQYKISTVGTMSNLILDTSNNPKVGAWGDSVAAGTYPVILNDDQNPHITAKPYIWINKGIDITLTRTNIEDETSVSERYTITTKREI